MLARPQSCGLRLAILPNLRRCVECCQLSTVFRFSGRAASIDNTKCLECVDHRMSVETSLGHLDPRRIRRVLPKTIDVIAREWNSKSKSSSGGNFGISSRKAPILGRVSDRNPRRRILQDWGRVGNVRMIQGIFAA